MMAAWDHLLAAASGALFPLLDMRDATALRTVSAASRAAVKQYPWPAYSAVHRWAEWCAAFPLAQACEANAHNLVALPHALPRPQPGTMPRVRRLLLRTENWRLPPGAIEAVAALLACFPQLAALRWAGGGFAPTAILAAVPLQLCELNVRGCQLYDEGMRLLAGALPQVPGLQKLVLASNFLTHAGVLALAGALQHVPQLTELNVSFNVCGRDGGLALADSLRHVPRLRRLCLGYFGMGIVVVRAMMNALRHVPRLQVLDIGGNTLAHSTWRELLACFVYVPQLETLVLASCTLCPRDIEQLDLRHVPRLTQLNLAFNMMGSGSECMQHVLAAIAATPDLSHLELSFNYFTDADARKLAAVLPQWPGLRIIMTGNAVTADGKAVLDAAAPNRVRCW